MRYGLSAIPRGDSGAGGRHAGTDPSVRAADPSRSVRRLPHPVARSRTPPRSRRDPRSADAAGPRVDAGRRPAAAGRPPAAACGAARPCAPPHAAAGDRRCAGAGGGASLVYLLPRAARPARHGSRSTTARLRRATRPRRLRPRRHRSRVPGGRTALPAAITELEEAAKVTGRDRSGHRRDVSRRTCR